MDAGTVAVKIVELVVVAYIATIMCKALTKATKGKKNAMGDKVGKGIQD